MCLLAGCGNQGAGVATDTQSARQTQQASEVTRSQTLTTEQRVNVMVTVPVSPLIGAAWRELILADKTLPGEAACEKIWERPTYAGPSKEDEATALLCAFKQSYSYAFTPTVGWPVEPKSSPGADYMLRTLAYVIHVNNLASDIAVQICTRPYDNLEEAKAEIKQRILEQRGYLLKSYAAALDLILMKGIIDLAGNKDVAFAKGPYHLTLGASGALLKYSGVDWFGNGNLSGKRYEIQLASMTGVAMNKAKTVTDGSAQQLSASEKAQTGVGK